MSNADVQLDCISGTLDAPHQRPFPRQDRFVIRVIIPLRHLLEPPNPFAMCLFRRVSHAATDLEKGWYMIIAWISHHQGDASMFLSLFFSCLPATVWGLWERGNVYSGFFLFYFQNGERIRVQCPKKTTVSLKSSLRVFYLHMHESFFGWLSRTTPVYNRRHRQE